MRRHILAGLTAGVLGLAGTAAAESTFSFAPDSGTFEVGEIVDITINVSNDFEGAENGARGFAFRFNWDPDVIQIVGGAAGLVNDPGNPYTTEMQTEFDEVAGSLLRAYAIFPISQLIYDGPAASFQVEFLQEAASTSLTWTAEDTRFTGFDQGVTTDAQRTPATFTVAPAVECDFSLDPTSATFGAAGGSASFDIIASEEDCDWTATSNDAWITDVTASGTGSDTITYTVAANTSPDERTGTITAGGQTFTVTQDGEPVVECDFSLDPTSESFDAAGGSSSFDIIASEEDCDWTAASNDAWITDVTASGTGSGTVSFTVAANAGPARTGSITAGGETFSVSQDDGCVLDVSIDPDTFTVDGGSGTITIDASNEDCSWNVSVDDLSVDLTLSTNFGTGSGTVTFAIGSNASPDERTFTFTVNEQNIVVTQEGLEPCDYEIDPTSATYGPEGGDSSFELTTNRSDCEWTASTEASWIEITSATSGSGDATITYSVSTNVGADRTAVIAIAGLEYTVTQTGPENLQHVLSGRRGVVWGTFLNALDDSTEDAEDIVYTVTTEPEHGTLSMTTFTQEDVNSGAVVYVNDGGEADMDSFAYSVTDGVIGDPLEGSHVFMIWAPYPDADGDGVPDELELMLGTDPNAKDTSGDGFEDGVLLALGFDPTADHTGILEDTAGDRVPDGFAPSDAFDTDGDGFPDFYEIAHGFDPDDADDVPALGDVTGSGDRTVSDALDMFRWFLGLPTVTEELDLDVFDLNRDGARDNVDAVTLIQFLLGNVPFLPTDVDPVE